MANKEKPVFGKRGVAKSEKGGQRESAADATIRKEWQGEPGGKNSPQSIHKTGIRR